MRGIEVREAFPRDLGAVLAVQHEAFTRVSEELRIPPAELPPLRESREDLDALLDAGTRFFVALTGSVLVGSVRALEEGGTVEVGRLVVATSHVRQGVATELMRFLEAAFPSASRFELFTGADAHAPLALYERLGYIRTRTQRLSSVELVWLAKEVQST